MREFAPARKTSAGPGTRPVPVDLVIVPLCPEGDAAAHVQTQAADLAVSLVGLDVSGADDRVGVGVGSSDPCRVGVLPLVRVEGDTDRLRILCRMRDWMRGVTEDGSPDCDSGLCAAIDALQYGDEAYRRPLPPRRYRSSGRAVGIVLLSGGNPEPDDQWLDLLRARGWPLYPVDVGLTGRRPELRVLARIAEIVREIRADGTAAGSSGVTDQEA